MALVEFLTPLIHLLCCVYVLFNNLPTVNYFRETGDLDNATTPVTTLCLFFCQSKMYVIINQLRDFVPVDITVEFFLDHCKK